MKLAGLKADTWEGEELECSGVEAEGPGEGANELETGGGETGGSRRSTGLQT